MAPLSAGGRTGLNCLKLTHNELTCLHLLSWYIESIKSILTLDLVVVVVVVVVVGRSLCFVCLLPCSVC